MSVGSTGYRAVLVRRQLTPGLISLLPGRAGLPPFISFSISYPELDFAVRRPMYRISELAQPTSNQAIQLTAPRLVSPRRVAKPFACSHARSRAQ